MYFSAEICGKMHCDSVPSNCANINIFVATQRAVSRKLSGWKLSQEKEINQKYTGFLFPFSTGPVLCSGSVDGHTTCGWGHTGINKWQEPQEAWLPFFCLMSALSYNSWSRRACHDNMTLDTVSTKSSLHHSL